MPIQWIHFRQLTKADNGVGRVLTLTEAIDLNTNSSSSTRGESHRCSTSERELLLLLLLMPQSRRTEYSCREQQQHLQPTLICTIPWAH